MKVTTALEQRRYDAEEEYLNSLHGPAPINPFRQFRQASGLSLQGLAMQSGLSKNALVRAEQGTYKNPLPSLVSFWVNRPTVTLSELEITEAYEDFQFYMRKRNFHYFGPNLTYSLRSPEHPFRQLRLQRLSRVDNKPLPVGPDEVSRALCLPVDTLRYFEKKYRLQQTVPSALTSALIFIGYTRPDVRSFCQDYEYWRAERINNDKQFNSSIT